MALVSCWNLKTRPTDKQIINLFREWDVNLQNCGRIGDQNWDASLFVWPDFSHVVLRRRLADACQLVGVRKRTDYSAYHQRRLPASGYTQSLEITVDRTLTNPILSFDFTFTLQRAKSTPTYCF